MDNIYLEKIEFHTTWAYFPLVNGKKVEEGETYFIKTPDNRQLKRKLHLITRKAAFGIPVSIPYFIDSGKRVFINDGEDYYATKSTETYRSPGYRERILRFFRNRVFKQCKKIGRFIYRK